MSLLTGRWTKEGGEDNYQNRRNKNDSKGKNGDSEKVKKEECHDHSLPPGIVLHMEWLTNPTVSNPF